MELKAFHYYLIALGGLVVLGLVIGLLLAGNSDYIKPLPQPIQHYTDSRDILSKVKESPITSVQAPLENATYNTALLTSICGIFTPFWWIILCISVVVVLYNYTSIFFLIINLFIMIIIGTGIINSINSAICNPLTNSTSSASASSQTFTFLPLIVLIGIIGVLIAIFSLFCRFRD